MTTQHFNPSLLLTFSFCLRCPLEGDFRLRASVVYIRPTLAGPNGHWKYQQ
jgi:hypothetical protein